MIINLRGTSGSGKSTLVRKIMELYGAPVRVKVEGRRQPLMYICPMDSHPSLAVIGHYETPCGGCDTIPSLDRVYELVEQAHQRGYDVLYEGLLVSAEVNRCIALAQRAPLVVVALDVPLELCLESVNARRRARDPEKPDVNPKNTISKHRAVQTAARRLREAGVDTHVCTDRESALAVARGILEI